MKQGGIMLQIIQSDQLTMGTREISEMLGKQHNHIKTSAERLAQAGVILTPAMREFEHRGNTYTEYRLGKRDCLILVAQNSPEFTAAIVDRWQELESGAAAKAHISAPITDALALAEVASRMLNMSNSSKLGMLQKVETKYGLTGLLPHYAVDAPADAVDGSSRPTKSLTELLKEADLRVSARVAYVILAEAGIVERKSRPSSKGADKEFWCLTATGMLYGKNITSPNNPRETQPHFFESRKDAIIKMIRGQA
jgi:phage regulator Rha-like protein